MEEYDKRIQAIEKTQRDIMTHLEQLSGNMLMQSTATNRIAIQIETFVKDAIDRSNGTVPQGTMRIEDHKAQQKFLMVTLGSVLSFVISVVAVSSRITSVDAAKEAINIVTKQATYAIEQSVDTRKP